MNTMNTMSTEFHPNSEVPTAYKPGKEYTCQACGEEKHSQSG